MMSLSANNNLKPGPRGGVILCGGKSSRMGFDKALLPFGENSMLETVVGIVNEVVDHIVVVANRSLQLPELPAEVQLVRDERPEYGPLEGIRVGLSAILAHGETVFITGCDSPLLQPLLVERMFDMLADYQAAVPVDGKFAHPLAAVYRTNVLNIIEELQAADEHRPRSLFDRVKTRRVPVDELREFDPELLSLQNLNRPEDYFALLEKSGFQCPPEIRQRLTRHCANR